MKKICLRLVGIAVVAAVLWLSGSALALINYKHTYTDDGVNDSGFDLFTAENLSMEGKAPTNGDLNVLLERLGMIIVAEFDISDGACRNLTLGSQEPWGYNFHSEVTNYGSGTGCAALRNSSLARLCPSCSGN